jgi:hypothetical protein
LESDTETSTTSQTDELSIVVASVTNKLFNNKQLIINNLDDIDTFLLQIIDIIRIANFNRSELLCNSFFSMIFNLTQLKIQSNESKYLDLCILNDITNCLVDYLGKLNKINTVKLHFSNNTILLINS